MSAKLTSTTTWLDFCNMTRKVRGFWKVQRRLRQTKRRLTVSGLWYKTTWVCTCLVIIKLPRNPRVSHKCWPFGCLLQLLSTFWFVDVNALPSTSLWSITFCVTSHWASFLFPLRHAWILNMAQGSNPCQRSPIESSIWTWRWSYANLFYDSNMLLDRACTLLLIERFSMNALLGDHIYWDDSTSWQVKKAPNLKHVSKNAITASNHCFFHSTGITMLALSPISTVACGICSLSYSPRTVTSHFQQTQYAFHRLRKIVQQCCVLKSLKWLLISQHCLLCSILINPVQPVCWNNFKLLRYHTLFSCSLDAPLVTLKPVSDFSFCGGRLLSFTMADQVTSISNGVESPARKRRKVLRPPVQRRKTGCMTCRKRKKRW